MLLLSGIGALVLLTTVVATKITSLPVVDLGYGLHQAIAYNESGKYYSFSNIRYAASPANDLRWRHPSPPATNRTQVENGSEPRICPQGTPGWQSDLAWIPEYLAGQPITLTKDKVDENNQSVTLANMPAQPLGTSEDCLFLDVMVPKHIFDSTSKNASGSPVMVWVHGGGYAQGSKTGSGNPAGLLMRSMAYGGNGVIFVALNYRLGAFGFLAGPELEDGIPNAGLYDQRFALEWIQKHIYLFGGDPERITVFGESAGAGSVLHQITAYGGAKGAPFSRAVLQSPGYLPQTSSGPLEDQFKNLCNYANVSTLAELRNVPSSVLIAANYLQVWRSTFGHYTYGPSVDGVFVPDLPSKLISAGNISDVDIMVAHNSAEGLLFTDPLIKTESAFLVYLRSIMPVASEPIIEYIANTLYPAQYNGSNPYTDLTSRISLLLAEMTFLCNANQLMQAKNYEGYAYIFSVYPGIHSQDVPYTFYTGGAPYFNGYFDSVQNTTVATVLQNWLVSYAAHGKPKTFGLSGIPKMVKYGRDAAVVDLGLEEIKAAQDPANNARCLWWQQGLYA